MLSVFKSNVVSPEERSPLLLCVPPLHPYLCCMLRVTSGWRFQLHVHRNAGTSSLVLMTPLTIPPCRLCGGNLEMLQGRALELDNICQEISIKDLCKRP